MRKSHTPLASQQKQAGVERRTLLRRGCFCSLKSHSVALPATLGTVLSGCWRHPRSRGVASDRSPSRSVRETLVSCIAPRATSPWLTVWTPWLAPNSRNRSMPPSLLLTLRLTPRVRVCLIIIPSPIRPPSVQHPSFFLFFVYLLSSLMPELGPLC